MHPLTRLQIGRQDPVNVQLSASDLFALTGRLSSRASR